MNSEEYKKLKHVAIIMDGNGRWAQERNHPRVWGHIRGSQVVSSIVQAADDCGVEALTLYAFSTENWSRPVTEVKVLFKLLKKFLQKERERIIKNRISFRVIGDIDNLPNDTQNLIAEIEDTTKEFEGLKLTFAFGYGGRKEIIDSVNNFIQNNPGKPLSEEDMESCLYRPEIGDVDLLIRTGGDHRISNYLLWQVAYAELYFSQTKWPEFSANEFQCICENFMSRERRFGSVSATDCLGSSKKSAASNLKVLGTK